MKNWKLLPAAALTFFLLTTTGSPATVISTDTAISAIDGSYDGTDLVISNCTVSLDGAHSFNSLLLTNGGVLTHSYFTNASASFAVGVTDEPQILIGTNAVTLLHTNVSPNAMVTDTGHTITYTNDIDFVQTSLPDGTTQLYRTDTSAIPDGATVLVTYSWTYTVSAGVNLIVTNDVIVASDGSINANGIGYGGGRGNGRGWSSAGSPIEGSGAGYGGSGGDCSTHSIPYPGGLCYGSVSQPVNLGSGGGYSYAGPGGSGGGLVKIVAGGNFSLNGTISANGANATNSRAGGGAGGSVWIITTNFSGSGSLAVNGGNGEPTHGGGGGGGRISIQCSTNTFSGSLTAIGGTGWQAGGAGTIFTQINGQTGMVRLDNGGRTGTYSTLTLPTLTDVVIGGKAIASPSGPFTCGNLTLATNGFLVGTSGVNLNLSVAGNLIIQPGGLLNMDWLGYLPGSGTSPGHGNSTGSYYPCSGGGHGGNGGWGSITNSTAPGTCYGSQSAPITFGSGGGSYASYSVGGFGGGAVQLTVAGNLQVDGIISANGSSGAGTGGGGGAGGSVYLTCNSLTGSGSIMANGGAGVSPYGGGGGGGRIAVISGANTFAGNYSAAGGGGANYGGAGTIYLQSGNQSQLILDNGGHAGGSTLLQSASSANLIVQNAAKGTANAAVTFAGLLVTSNAWLTQFNPSSSVLTINGDATFQPGGGFLADLGGKPGGQGSGVGAYNAAIPSGGSGGGGGYGGRGGYSVSNAAAGGYYLNDSPGVPSSVSSGSGGGGNSGSAFGGYGGGFIQMTVNGTLQLDGFISANGGNGNGNGGGGGAGGGIYLNVGIFAGSGSLSANGGNGANTVGGGGGGGRIAVYYNSKSFNGTVTALGGGGANYGGAGTIYLKSNYSNHATLMVDNGGHAGADTPFPSYYSPVSDLTLRNGAVGSISSSAQFGDLVVSSNSWLMVTNGSLPASGILTAANITVQSGGGIEADSAGYVAGAGSGPGNGNGSQPPYYPCSGAGHGGYGAVGNSNLLYTIYPAGTYYDNAVSPAIAGSGGGSSGTSLGGRGGGVIQMSLTGNLQVDGTLSANGGNGSGPGGGGGSGGSLNVTCGALKGSGTIAVNGGSGVSNYGGGGGGGMIAVNFISNVFTGTISAYGGGGANYGGAGTICLNTNNSTFVSLTTLIADNGNHRGANTPLTLANNWIIRNAAVAQPASQNSTITSLLVESNAWLFPTINGGGQLSLNILGNATIQSGGSIYADALGSPQNQGNGHGVLYGSSPLQPGSGAGHGGYGGYGVSNLVSGGLTYGSTTLPTLMGSGGGGSSPNSIGGAGGGYINLHVNGTLQLDGILSANGGNGTGSGGGGGSGGSLNLNFGTLAGSGSILANGGNGANAVGGGGGGGRIALYFNTNLFAGSVSAYGGGGWAYGGAGTVYYKTNSQNLGLLVLDNADHAGTNTSFDLIPMNVTVQKAAVGFLPAAGSWSPNDILIRTNGTLAAAVSTSQRTVTANNLTIETGGVLTADSAGYGPQSGPGAGYNTTTYRGGAGHGGYGGYNPVVGGYAYDSISIPAMAGSGGGTLQSPPYAQGGYGGGALKMNVSGTLTVNGRLSANGGNGGYSAGGGSGGSLNLQNISFLTGNGVISANGGSTTGTAGGGGGGRIAMNCVSNNFAGQITAYGGSGQFAGSAGTIYQTVPGVKTLIVDNGGLASTSTPLAASFGLPPSPFDLNIAGAATVVPITPLPLLSNLTIAAGSKLTMPVAKSNLTVAVLHDLDLAGSLNVDYLGFPQTNGPGAGASLASQGSGGGYGGLGGSSSSGAPGGTMYGSALQPVDFGSGGGSGANTITGGSQGGGALRVSVGGTLIVNGNLSADGNFGWQDDSGGGAGGSVWLTAKTLAGTGNISAAGGDGDLFGGGGGGGGRIAIYAPTNLFAGTTNASGGFGAWSGTEGTIFLSSVIGDFQVASQSPTGVVSNTVSFVDVSFNEAVDPASVSASAFTLVTPVGIMPGASLNATVIGAATVRVGFPAQNVPGDYSLQVATTLTNILGQPLAQSFTGNFTIALPTISGTVADTNGAPVAGVLVQPDGGLTGAATDTNGFYSIGVPPGWNGTVTPSFNNLMFVPGSLAYTNVTDALTNQNFVIVPTIAPNLSSSLSGTNLSLGWSGLAGVTYQAWWSTNLVDWLPCGDAIPGTNGPQQIVLPVDASPSMFYRVGASD